MCGIVCIVQYGGQIDMKRALNSLKELTPRGPDRQEYKIFNKNDVQIFFGFTRLAIMDTSDAGLQPFVSDSGNAVICNGEIYNYKDLIQNYGLAIKSGSDCEVLSPLLEKFTFVQTITKLDAEFATVFFDNIDSKIYAARDRYGVRPLYYGYNNSTKTIIFASELKAAHSITEFVRQVVPTEYMSLDISKPYDIEKIVTNFSYFDIPKCLYINDVDSIKNNIRLLLTKAVAKRLNADRPIGFLLSGGLDSSLIVSIACKILGPSKIVCFSIGIEGSPDVEAAKQVVKHLQISNHYIIPFTTSNGLENLQNVIKKIETYDVTTIRASTPQELMAAYISKNTDIKVILSGEGSDEIHGSYRYFRDAPDSLCFNLECVRLLRELCYFDNQRTDRTMAGNGLEVRVPFLDHEYVEYILSIDPKLFMYRKGYMEKQIIRDSFVGYLPHNVLYRSKEAFSDAVSNNEENWAITIQNLAENTITDNELEHNEYIINKPRTKEALLFRNLYSKYYKNCDNVIPHYWLPRFQKEEVLDPSARVLKCY